MTKELFIKTLNFIKEQRKKQDKFVEVLESLSPDNYCNCWLYNEYEEKVVELLHDCLNIDSDNDILEWWFYDCDFGKDNAIVNNIDVSDPGVFYDYLVGALKND